MSLLKQVLVDAPGDPKAALVYIEKNLPENLDEYTEIDYVEIIEFIRGLLRKYHISLDGDIDLDSGLYQKMKIRKDQGEKRAEFIILLANIRGSHVSLMRDDIIGGVSSLLDDFDQKVQESKRSGRLGRANLSSVEKESLREHLDHIRGVIDRSAIPEYKKNALFKRIGELQAEVDRAGTRTDGFFAFWGELSLVAGEMAENAKPALDEAKAVLRILVARRAEDEDLKLAKPDIMMSLPRLAGEDPTDQERESDGK